MNPCGASIVGTSTEIPGPVNELLPTTSSPLWGALITASSSPRLPATVLDSLAAQAAAVGPRAPTILFLGDNVYPAGTTEPVAANYADALRRLDAQIRAVPSGATGIFVPGNHDWSDGNSHTSRSQRASQ